MVWCAPSGELRRQQRSFSCSCMREVSDDERQKDSESNNLIMIFTKNVHIIHPIEFSESGISRIFHLYKYAKKRVRLREGTILSDIRKSKHQYFGRITEIPCNAFALCFAEVCSLSRWRKFGGIPRRQIINSVRSPISVKYTLLNIQGI